MQLLHPDSTAALFGLRAMKTVASTPGPISPSQRVLMETACKVILRIEADIDALPLITPAELAANFPSPELREQLVNGMFIVALADDIPAPETIATIEAFASALHVPAPEVANLRLLSEHHMLLFKLDFMRRSQVGDALRDELQQVGLFGLVKTVLGLRGLIEDKELAGRYRAWEHLPQGTLGRAMWEYFDRNQFTVPGDRFGFPETAIYHDFSHVLGDYSTSPGGEIEVAAFIAGFKSKTPLYTMLFTVLTFSTGVNARPMAGTTTHGVLGEPGQAERMFAALERGNKVNTDLSQAWDFWSYIDQPIDDVRRQLNVVPKG
jgi:hypothetical protein